MGNPWHMFFGENTGRKLHALWNSFIGKAVEGNTAVDIETMRLSEQEIAKTVEEQLTAVAEFDAFAAESEGMFKSKLAEEEKFSAEAKGAAKRGDMDGARALLVEARSIRQIMPSLEERAQAARSNAESAKAELNFHKQELRELRADLKNHEELHRLDDAQRKVNKAKTSFNTDSAKRAYDKSADAVKRSALTSVAESKLIEDPAKKSLYNARQAALSSDLDSELEQLMAPHDMKLLPDIAPIPGAGPMPDVG
jgi:phage shock protein A